MKRITLLLESDHLWAAVLSIYAASLFFSNEFTIAAFILFIIAALVRFVYNVYYKKEQVSKPDIIGYCWASVYLVRVIWLLVSNDAHYGLKWMDTCLPFILFPLLFQYLSLNERIIKTVLTVFVHFTLLFCIIALFSVAYHSHTTPVAIKDWLLNPKDYLNLTFTLTGYFHPSFLCVIYLFALPAGLYLRCKYRSISITEITILIVMEAAMLAFTGARVGIIIFPLLLAMMLVYSVPKKRRIITSGAIVVLAGVTAVILSQSDCRILDRFQDAPRAQLWKTAIISIKEKPMLGVGTGGMRAVIGTPEINETIGQSLSYPHNQYLGEVMHFGIIGAIPLFVTLIYLLITAIRHKYFLLLSLMLIIFVFMITEMPFDMYKSINYFLFFTSLLLLQKQKSFPA